MNSDDNYQRIRNNVKVSVKGIVTPDVTVENLVKGSFETTDTKSGKVLENPKTTVAETWEIFDENVKEAHKRGLIVAGIDKVE